MKRASAVAAIAALALGGMVARADDASRIAAIRDRAIAAADVLRVARLAEACGRRNAAWAARVRAMVTARQDADATQFAGEVEGGREGVLWLMLGARLVTDAAADAEHDRYGEVACEELAQTGNILGVDRLLAAGGW